MLKKSPFSSCLITRTGLAQQQPLLGADKLPTLTLTFLDTCHSHLGTLLRHCDLGNRCFVWRSGAPESPYLLFARPGWVAPEKSPGPAGMLRIPNWLAAGRFQLKCKQTPPLVPRLDFFGSQPPERLTLTHGEVRQDEEHFCRPGTNLNLIAKLQPDVRDSRRPEEVV